MPESDMDYKTESKQKLTKGEKNRRFNKIWFKRIDRAEKLQKGWLKEGDKINKYIEGDQWPTEEEDTQNPDVTWSKTTANRMSPLMHGYMASLLFRQPNVVGRPTRGGPGFAERAQLDAALLNYIGRETNIQQEFHLGIQDGVKTGVGWWETLVDKERGIPRAYWRNVHDVVVDPDADTTLESAAWVAVRETMNIDDARKEFDDKTLMPNAKSRADHDPVNTRATSVGPAKDAPQDEKNCLEDKIIIYRVWVRGDKPDISDDADITAGPQGRMLILADNRGDDGPIKDEPWPFVLDHDAFPLVLVRPQLVSGRLLSYSPLKAGYMLQRHINWATTYIATQMRRTSQRKHLIPKELIGEDELEKMMSPEADEVIRTNGALAMNPMHTIDFGSLSNAPMEGLNTFNSQFNDVTGFNEIFGGVRSARSATEASIRDERAQTLVNLMRENTEWAMTKVYRQLLQIAWWTMDADEVAELVGDEKMVFHYPVNVPVVDPMTGQPAVDPMSGQPMTQQEMKTIKLWNDEMTPEEIRREVDIMIEPGSTRKVNRDQEIADTGALLDRALSIIGQFASLGLRVDPQALLTYVNWFMEKMAKATGHADFEQVAIPPEALSLPPEPEPAVNMKEGDVTINEGSRDVSISEAAPPAEPDQAALLRAATEQGMPPEAVLAGLFGAQGGQ